MTTGSAYTHTQWGAGRPPAGPDSDTELLERPGDWAEREVRSPGCGDGAEVWLNPVSQTDLTAHYSSLCEGGVKSVTRFQTV